MARFYSNENFPLPAVLELRKLGHDVLTSLQAGQANQQISDEAVLQFATVSQRAVLTLNRRHFAKQHDRSPRHAGIVACTVDADYVMLAGRIHDAVGGATDLTGLLIRVVRPQG